MNNVDAETKERVIRLETKLDAHQRAFEKHEARDDKRFNDLSSKTTQYHEQNVNDHQELNLAITRIQTRIAWIMGIGLGAYTIVQAAVAGWIKLFP